MEKNYSVVLVILELTAARGLMLRSKADGRFALGPTAGPSHFLLLRILHIDFLWMR